MSGSWDEVDDDDDCFGCPAVRSLENGGGGISDRKDPSRRRRSKCSCSRSSIEAKWRTHLRDELDDRVDFFLDSVMSVLLWHPIHVFRGLIIGGRFKQECKYMDSVHGSV